MQPETAPAARSPCWRPASPGIARPGAQGSARPARPKADHRRLRRRSERHRHLLADRHAVRLRDCWGDAVLLPANGGDPGDQRAHRPGDRPGHHRQHPRALLPLAASSDRHAAADREHDQSGSGSPRDGRGTQACRSAARPASRSPL